jgi:hypothetical protein
MPMRARIRGVSALFVLTAVAALVGVAACGGSSSSGRTAAGADGTTSTTTTTAGHAHGDTGGTDMGGMDMGGRDMGGTGMNGAGHAHDATLPPLAQRLADATPDQRAATADLLARTKATLATYASEPAARAAGFVPANDTKRVVHYANVANRRDDHELDPSRPEGLVYFRDPTGTLRLLGAFFTVRPGEPAPTPGGDIFSWHTHDPSCGSFLVPAGTCTDTFRMLHIWVAPGAPDPWIQPVVQAFGRR